MSKYAELSIGNLFKNDPTILFEKIFCDFCKEPTGSTSKCPQLNKKMMNPFAGSFGEDDEDTENTLLISNNKGGGIPLSIFSEGCIFRRHNLWKASLNYYMSIQLADHLSQVPGVESIIPTTVHSRSPNRILDPKDSPL